MALVIGLAALTAQASESDLVRDIQRYCTVCWRNARLDPTLWDDCTQEVCCRLLTKARAGELEFAQVLADDTPERRNSFELLTWSASGCSERSDTRPSTRRRSPAPITTLAIATA